MPGVAVGLEDGKPLPFAGPTGPEKTDVLTKEEQAVARQQWRSGKCTWCGGLHLRACPRVRKFEFGNDGKTVTSVEFWQANQWRDTDVLWPEDMGWEDDEGSPFDPPASVDTETKT
jgi:hypothetical protein